jgi:hypothetical protein
MQHVHRDAGGIRVGDEGLAIAASAMLMPPEAEPVMPASAVTVTLR